MKIWQGISESCVNNNLPSRRACLEILVFGTKVKMVNRKLWGLDITNMYSFTHNCFQYKNIVRLYD